MIWAGFGTKHVKYYFWSENLQIDVMLIKKFIQEIYSYTFQLMGMGLQLLPGTNFISLFLYHTADMEFQVTNLFLFILKWIFSTIHLSNNVELYFIESDLCMEYIYILSASAPQEAL